MLSLKSVKLGGRAATKCSYPPAPRLRRSRVFACRPSFRVSSEPACSAALPSVGKYRAKSRVACNVASGSGAITYSTDIARLLSCTVRSIPGDEEIVFEKLWSPAGQRAELTLLLFFTHWGDLGSWELAQRLVAKWDQLQAAGVHVVAVGLGSSAAGAEFARLTGFPVGDLYADTTSACYKALDFSRGWLPDSDMSGYLKLLGMLAGLGSPGTMREVIRGYIGDPSAKPIFEESSALGRAFGVLGQGYQRPFELATQRLFNMNGSLANWSQLAPTDSQQLVQQGGCLLMRSGDIIYRHDDSGILMTTDVDALLKAVEQAAALSPQ